MGGIDKLDTICLLSKPAFQSKSLASLTHSLTLAMANAWFLYCGNTQ